MVMHVSENSNLSQEIFATDTWGAVICSLGHGRKHMLTILPTIWRPGLKATSHSRIFDIPMRPLREDQKHRHVLPVKEGPQLP